MSPITIALIVLVCVFGGVLLGMFLRTVLPEHHLSEESKHVVQVATGLIATLAALVLGDLVTAGISYISIRSIANSRDRASKEEKFQR